MDTNLVAIFLEDDKEVVSELSKLEQSHLDLEKAMSKLSFDIEEEKHLYRIAIESAMEKRVGNKNKPLFTRSSEGEVSFFG